MNLEPYDNPDFHPLVELQRGAIAGNMRRKAMQKMPVKSVKRDPRTVTAEARALFDSIASDVSRDHKLSADSIVHGKRKKELLSARADLILRSIDAGIDRDAVAVLLSVCRDSINNVVARGGYARSKTSEAA